MEDVKLAPSGSYASIMQNIIGRSCNEETADPVEGKVTGEIPKWIQGTLIRNGPGMTEIGGQKYNHYFDGMALLHSFGISDGRVTYRNKFVKSVSYTKNTQANRIVVNEFGTIAHPDPCTTLFDRLRSFFKKGEFMDNTNVNVLNIGDGYYTATETNIIYRVDPKTAETLEKVNLSDYLAVNTATAHAQWDKDGTMYNIGSSYKLYTSYNFIKFPPSEKPGLESFEKASIVCEIPVSHRLRPSYYHSFAMTENYLVLAEQSLGLNLTSVLWQSVVTVSNSYNDCLTFDPNQKVNFIVVDKHTGKQLSQKYLSNAFMVFHHANSYEEDGHLVLDLTGYETGDIVKVIGNEELRKAVAENSDRITKGTACQIRRYVLPLDINKEPAKGTENLVTLPGCNATATLSKDGSIFCTYENMSPGLEALEMVQYNYDYNTKKYSKLYGIGRRPGEHETSLIKLNLEDKSHVMWTEKGKYPSEPVFVASPGATNDEDDGILLSCLLHEDEEKKASLLFLDAKTMNELGRAEFLAKSAVTSTFHGPYIPDETRVK